MLRLKRENRKSDASPVKKMRSPRSIGMLVIGLFKVGKGILFVALGLGLLKLIDSDVDDIARNIISLLHIDEENHILAINIAIVTYLLFIVIRKEKNTLRRDPL
jgi:hypothetical protein